VKIGDAETISDIQNLLIIRPGVEGATGQRVGGISAPRRRPAVVKYIHFCNTHTMRDDLLDILCCPENHATLTPANEALVREVNERIRGSRLRNKAGREVNQPIDGGLVRADGDLLYPIVDQIPVLLRDEAIPLDQLDR
jgi:uncharacterized protein YbaR (Trm112 family)